MFADDGRIDGDLRNRLSIHCVGYAHIRIDDDRPEVDIGAAKLDSGRIIAEDSDGETPSA